MTEEVLISKRNSLILKGGGYFANAYSSFVLP